MAINEDQQQSLEEVARIRSERIPEPKEPIKIETEGVFNQDYLDQSDPAFLTEMETFMENPMAAIMKPLTDYLQAIRPKPLELPKSEHKVRIYQLRAEYNLEALERVAAEIEDLLNDGYCCHMPTVVNDYVIMDFSRRRETEEDEREQ